MIYQFGGNLITKQKHIHLRKVSELLKMKLGTGVLGKLYLKGCWVFFSLLNGGSAPVKPLLPHSTLQRELGPESELGAAELEFMSLHRWQMVAWTYQPFAKKVKYLCSRRVVFLLLWNYTSPANTGRPQQHYCPSLLEAATQILFISVCPSSAWG